MVMPRYYALVFQCTTGAVVQEIPLSADPTWTQQINQPGSWTVTTQVGAGGLPKATLHGVLDAGRFGVAVCWGSGTSNDYICQAGPIWSYQLQSESPPILQIGGSGFWGLLNARLQVASSWTGNSVALSAGADTTYTSSMQGTAVGILQNAVARSSLPLDVPTAVSGSIVHRYYGYDLISAGQRLQELTQEEPTLAVPTPANRGPDILFRPYFSDTSHIRWQALIGTPTLAQPGAALYFDYGSSLQSILPVSDGSKLCTTAYVKGNGMEYSTLWSSATDSTLTNGGWPLLEYVDTSHTSVIDPKILGAFAAGDQKLYGRPLETWTAVVRADAQPVFGSYTAGVYAQYNVINHPLLLDAVYSQRIIGLSNGQNIGELVHILQAIPGQV